MNQGRTLLTVKQTADSYVVASATLRLIFERAADRWRHIVDVFANDDWLTVLTSVEGTPSETLPPSPPFQELRLEQLDDITHEFQLFGRGAGHVYSAAVRVDGVAASIDCDLCVKPRHPGLIERAVSTYEVCSSDSINRASDSKIILNAAKANRRLSLESLPLDGHPPARWTLAPSPHHAQITCHDPAQSWAAAKTLRWHYRIGLISIE